MPLVQPLPRLSPVLRVARSDWVRNALPANRARYERPGRYGKPPPNAHRCWPSSNSQVAIATPVVEALQLRSPVRLVLIPGEGAVCWREPHLHRTATAGGSAAAIVEPFA